MHAPPSVSHPVGRSAFALRLLLLVVLAGFAAVAAWTVQAGWSWRQPVGFAAVAACGLVAWRGWRRSPGGMLHWDGAAWAWEEGGPLEPGRPEIALDLQRRLLLRWRADAGRIRWFWLERTSDASHWDALRRAVYSRASTPVHAAGKPPAAEQ